MDLTPNPNDRLRLFGILMKIPRFHPQFQRLCDGVTVRDQLDSTELSLKQIYADVRLTFKNDEVVINLPDAANDLENIHILDANDESQISIDRDCKKLIFYHHNVSYVCYIIITHVTLLLINLEQICGPKIFGKQH